MTTIIDADGHLLEPPSVWQEYTEPAYRTQVIQIAKDAEGIDGLKINGELRARPQYGDCRGLHARWHVRRPAGAHDVLGRDCPRRLRPARTDQRHGPRGH